jgi:aminopeptidase
MKKAKEDRRIVKLARLLVDYSCRIKKNDKVLIQTDLPAKPLVLELYKQILQRGAYPRIEWNIEGFSPIYYNYASFEQLRNYPKITEYVYKKMDAFIFIRAPIKREECKDCDLKKIILRRKVTEKVTRIRLKKKYVLFDWPTKTLAKAASMSLKQYKDFVFSACLQDWEKERRKMQRIKKLLDKSDKVRIIGEDTDLTFSTKGKNAVINYGPDNMPAGEVFTAIREKTANGFVRFTYPLRYLDQKISNIKLWFKEGKVVKAKSTNMKALNALLNADEGARYIGELGIGCNSKIKRFTDNLLFDEKIGGTIHLALGMAYPECRGRNKSAVHADIVKDMRKGKIIMDGKLVYENGKFKL